MSRNPKQLSLAEKIFSVRNEGTRKVICILGLKIKFRTPRLVYRELNARMEEQSQNFNDELCRRLEQQSERFDGELKTLRAGIEEQSRSFDGKLYELRTKLIYKIHEYCPDDKRALAMKDWFFESTGETLNLDDPQTYNEKIGSIIFSVWPGTQTPAFSDLKIA